MKKLLLHLVLAAAAAGAGWFTGTPSSGQGKRGRLRPQTAGATQATPGTSQAAWQNRLSAVRAAPGASSETAWIQWTFSIPDADIPAAIAKLNPHSDFHALRCLYARWVKLNPGAAWASFRASDIPKECLHFYLPEERQRGMAGSRLSENPRSLIAGRMLTSWMTVDPASARAFAAKLAVAGSAEAKEVAVYPYELIRITGKSEDGTEIKEAMPDKESAAAALQLPAGDSRVSALRKVCDKWLRSDPAAAGAWIRQLSAEDRGQLSFDTVKWAMRESGPADRAATLTVILNDQELTGEEIGKGFLENSGEDLFADEESNFHNTSTAVGDWIRADPAGAQKWLSTLPENSLKPALTGAAAGALVATDAKAALALINQTGGDQQVAVKGLMAGWVETDAPAALAWAGKINDAFLRDACREMAAASLAGTDPELAIETAQTITDAAVRRKIHAAVRQNLSWNPAALSEIQARFPGDSWAESPSP